MSGRKHSDVVDRTWREFLIFTMPVTILLAFLIAGLGLLSYGAISGYRLFSFVSSSQTAEGTIVSLRRFPDTGGFRAVIEFRTAQGERHTFESRIESNPPAYAEGERVEVMYQPSEPYRAEIRALPTLWFSSIFVGIMGIFVIFYSGIVLIQPHLCADSSLE